MKKTVPVLSVIFALFFAIGLSFGQNVSDEARRHFDRGTAATEAKDFQAAIKEFGQAVSLAPSWPDAAYNLGLAHEAAGNFKDAITSYREYLRLAPDANDVAEVKSLINKLEYKAAWIAGSRPPFVIPGPSRADTGLTSGAANKPPERDIDAKDEYGRTPLHNAAIQGRKDLAEELIAQGADIKSRDNGGYTPLHGAAGFGQKDVAEVLIARGADIDAKSSDGDTPLYTASAWGHKEVVALLIAKGADLNVRNKTGKTALQAAVDGNRLDAADLLRKAGAK